jgi:protein-S-isoprenylcysteine O-methyltransferase Ste14
MKKRPPWKAALKFFHLSSRTGMGFLAAFIMLVTADPRPRWLLTAGSLAVVGMAIRLWSSGCIRKDETLATTGPFALVRNPLYLGSTVIAVGFAVANRNPYFIGAITLLLGYIYVRTIRKEEKLLREIFGEAYEEYCRKVPRLIPFRAPYGGLKALTKGFAIRQALRNQEADATLGVAILLGALSYPAFYPDQIHLFRVIVCGVFGVFICGRAILFPILKSDSESPVVRVLQFFFSRKKYRKVQVPN